MANRPVYSFRSTQDGTIGDESNWRVNKPVCQLLRGVALEALAADDPRVIGDFRLQSRLGAGGMGRVYLGFSPAGRAVAVKVIHPHLARDPSFAARFRREVAAAQAVNAVYATPVVAAGPDDTPPWLATAFVPGPPLHDVLAKNGPLPEEAVWKLAAGLAEGLRAVHASGLVHRDLKPGNVLLAADGPRLIDFGIARVMDGTQLTDAGGVLGTPTYMSPEQAQGREVGPPSDVFSLGGVVCFAATGQPPFGTSAQAATLLYKIVYGEPQLDGLSPQLRSLVAACLAKDPAARPTPAQLASALLPASPDAGFGGTGFGGTGFGGPVTPSRLAFWPAPVEQLISDYRAQLDADASPADGGWQPPAGGWEAPAPSAGGWGAAGEPTAPPGTVASVGATTVRPGRHAQQTVAGGMSRRRALAALAGAVTAGLGIAGYEIDDHLGSGSGQGKLTAAPSLPRVPAGKQAWRFDTGADNVQSVTMADDVVYAGTGGNTVFAVSAATGKRIWRAVSASGSNDGATLVGGSLVLAGFNGVFALAAKTGKPLWNVKAPDGEPQFTGAGGVVYAGFAAKTALGGGVTAIDPANGDILWSYEFPSGAIAGDPVAAGGVVYVTTDQGELYALTAASGNLRKRVTGFGQFGASPNVVRSGVVYAGLDDKVGTVVAVDMTSGKTVWRRTVGRSLYGASLDEQNGTLFAGVTGYEASGGLHSLDAATGKEHWFVPVNGGVNEGPIVAGGVVYTGNGSLGNGQLQAFSAATGAQLWNYLSPDGIGEISVVAGSRAFFGSGGYVYSFGA